ncbi:hypothetical protein FSP39_009009 [Pinctada imbricata]|uniref:Uncharacterized protein n=1 Tax=Pinctada imbricata TaxID=66713 RepID=A0AA88XDG0_PINIB|nr:hypothetical protein FSP39_009009 [Pinctada imbricata]
MDKVFERLGALTHIEQRLGQFESSLKSVNTEVSGLKKKIDEFESSASFTSEKLDEISKNSKDFSDRIQKISKGTESIRSENIALKANIRGLKEEMENVKERQIELQARSMRENLIFHGIDESAEGEVEDCEEKLKHFIQDKLQVTKTMEFHRVHRLGKRQPGKTRGMIAKFVNYKDRELVRWSAFTALRGNEDRNIGVNEQFPREINERRKRLWPHYKSAKSQDKRAHLAYDKLYVDGTLFRIEPEISADDPLAQDREDEMDVIVAPDEQNVHVNSSRLSATAPVFSPRNDTVYIGQNVNRGSRGGRGRGRGQPRGRVAGRRR